MFTENPVYLPIVTYFLQKSKYIVTNQLYKNDHGKKFHGHQIYLYIKDEDWRKHRHSGLNQHQH